MAGIIHHDSRFSMSVVPTADGRYSTATSKQVRASSAKRLERQLVNLWKVLTRSRSKQRASFVPRDFVSVTSRRRSTMPSQFSRARA